MAKLFTTNNAIKICNGVHLRDCRSKYEQTNWGKTAVNGAAGMARAAHISDRQLIFIGSQDSASIGRRIRGRKKQVARNRARIMELSRGAADRRPRRAPREALDLYSRTSYDVSRPIRRQRYILTSTRKRPLGSKGKQQLSTLLRWASIKPTLSPCIVSTRSSKSYKAKQE